ncbi:unnamed protein product [Rotaria socialis]
MNTTENDFNTTNSAIVIPDTNSKSGVKDSMTKSFPLLLDDKRVDMRRKHERKHTNRVFRRGDINSTPINITTKVPTSMPVWIVTAVSTITAIERPSHQSTINASLPRTTNKPNPFISYHSQASKDFDSFHAYIPTLADISRNVLPLPDMSQQHKSFERDNLKLHQCKSIPEAYSGSFLTTKEHILSVPSEDYKLSWTNVAMVSYIHMKDNNNTFHLNPLNNTGDIIQSLDVLDLSVIHLSEYERSLRRYKNILWKTKHEAYVESVKFESIKSVVQRLANLNNPKSSTYRQINYSVEAKCTVVIIPFIGPAMGTRPYQGHLYEYIIACFWSFFFVVMYIILDFLLELPGFLFVP